MALPQPRTLRPPPMRWQQQTLRQPRMAPRQARPTPGQARRAMPQPRTHHQCPVTLSSHPRPSLIQPQTSLSHRKWMPPLPPPLPAVVQPWTMPMPVVVQPWTTPDDLGIDLPQPRTMPAGDRDAFLSRGRRRTKPLVHDPGLHPGLYCPSLSGAGLSSLVQTWLRLSWV